MVITWYTTMQCSAPSHTTGSIRIEMQFIKSMNHLILNVIQVLWLRFIAVVLDASNGFEVDI